jgi:anaerobic selenocysteine-containing dehydrogenase
MIRLVLENGWQDQAFCDRFVAPLDALRAAVEPFTLDYVAHRTGIDRALIEQATEMFARARRKSGSSGTGPNMSVASNLNEHMLEALNAICGAYRRAGDVVRNTGALFGRSARQERVIPPCRYWESGPKLKTVDLGRLFGEYPTPLLHREIIGNGEQKIRALIVVGGNPLKAIPDPDRMLAAFKSLDLLVTVDPRPTETASISDYVIATSLPYERYDYTGMFDGYFVKNFAQLATPLLQPPAGVMDDWEFFWGMARRAGKPLELKQPGFGYAHPDIPGPSLTLNLDQKPTTEDLVKWMISQGKVSYEQLLASPAGMVVDEDVVIAPAGEDDGARLDPCPPDVAAELAAVLATSNDDPAYPFKLIARRQLESMNSAYSNASKTRRRYPVNPAFMHPLDMQDLGIEDGAGVEITSDNGSIIGMARKDATLRRGVVSMTHAWGTVDQGKDPEGQTGGFVGRLISLERDLQAINYMVRMSAIPVSVQPHVRRHVA